MPPPASERLFTPRFFIMCGFSFTAFLSVLQLLPTAPFRIRDLGGSTFASGLFLGLLTYASALSAPFTGALADRIGRVRMLTWASAFISGFSIVYGVLPDYRWMLILVPIHGVVWSGLLAASAAYMTGVLPPARRSEGISYWGLSSNLALALAPVTGFWLYRHGWVWLCAVAAGLGLAMAFISTRLREDPRPAAVPHEPAHHGGLIEWRVLVLASPLFLYSFSYGGITSFSAVFAEQLGIAPKGVFLSTLAITILLSRPFSGTLGDRLGYRRVFIPCLIVIAAGLLLLAVAESRAGFILAAVVFGLGFGTAYPVFVGYVLHDVREDRRGAAFGAILAAFDTGIGTGSTLTGWLVQRVGFAGAFGAGAALAALALPAFLLAERVVHQRAAPVGGAASAAGS